ncbi:MAG: cytochrome c peroxidase [Pseudohongiellaceae bacterium]
MPITNRLCVLGGLLLILPCVTATGAENELRRQAETLFGTLDPVTAEEKNDPVVDLGRALFWDESLSLNGGIACASCHLAEDWGADRRLRSIDARGNPTRRHSQTVFNTQAAAAGLRWLGDRASGAAQARGSVTGSMGFAGHEDLIPALRSGNYAVRFEAAYPEQTQPLTVDNYARALQAYQETLRTPAPFDDWLRGDAEAMSEQQQRGLRHFIEIGCAGCHDGALLGGNRLAKFGLLNDFRPLTGSSEEDVGLMLSTGEEADRDMFRIQPLRNVAATAPYFHDGSVQSLERAVAVMAELQLGEDLNAGVIGDIVAFLHALSGEVPSHYGPP